MINVNPFKINKFIGNFTLSPEIDTRRGTDSRVVRTRGTSQDNFAEVQNNLQVVNSILNGVGGDARSHVE